MIQLNDKSNLDGVDILVLSPTPTYPLDYGNRKRIFYVCRQLKDRGAKIHFLHYPGEWRSKTPYDAMHIMAQQWDSFHLVSPTRYLHQAAQGEDHTIDEWWDYSIGDYLKYLFERNYFDVFIVNYTYLSKALEFAPSHVYKILDTHDQFSDRRKLLESQGISPEFFYTTSEQEAIALERADLVWAIKEQEAEFFRSIASTPVITVPHIEPQRSIQRKYIDADTDYLVLGMIGGRNSINVSNTRAFLEQAIPKFRKYLAPIKIKLAGSMCADLSDLEGKAAIQLMGRIENVEDFYAAIDVAVVPMTFSTGLKIKAVEALTTGLPLIAHKHALEGIPLTHPYHQCESIDEIVEHCLDIAFDPILLPDLAKATHESYQAMGEEVDGAINNTVIKLSKAKPYTVIVLNEAFFNQKSYIYEHTVQTVYYLKHLTEIIYYVDTPINAQQATVFEWHDAIGKVVLSPHAASILNLIDHTDSSLGISYSISSLESICQRRNVICIWMFNIPLELRNGVPDSLKNLAFYLRTDVIRNYYPNNDKLQLDIQSFSDIKNLTIVNCSLSALSQESNLTNNLKTLIVPFWKQPPEQLRNYWSSANNDETRVIILANSQSILFAYLVWQLCTKVIKSVHKPLAVMGEQLAIKEVQLESQFKKHICSVLDLSSDMYAWDKRPSLVIDLSSNDLSFAFYRETLKRLGIIIIEPDGHPNAQWHDLIRNSSNLKPNSIKQLLEILIKINGECEYKNDLKLKVVDNAGITYAQDSGWCNIWKDIFKDVVK
ncbi:MAG: glycosyltransferase [Waterburya sp.]